MWHTAKYFHTGARRQNDKKGGRICPFLSSSLPLRKEVRINMDLITILNVLVLLITGASETLTLIRNIVQYKDKHTKAKHARH